MAKWAPYIAVRAVQPFVAALEALGVHAQPLLDQVGIARATLDNADGQVPQPAMAALWERALVTTGDDNLGIHLAECAPISSFEVHAYALLSSPTLRDAYRRSCRYQRLIHEVNDLTFEEGPDEGVLRHSLPGGRPAARHPAEFLVTLWVRFGRLITGYDWSPGLVCFAHSAPPDTSEHARVFSCPVHFTSGRTAMHISNHVLDAPNQRADSALLALLDRYAAGLLSHMPRQTTLSDRVRSQLLNSLTDGAPSAATIAQVFHLSVRTFHRTLSDEGTSFHQLLDQVRQEQAVALLLNPRSSIVEIGFLLGFSELSSFHRAFKRWTGKTPAEYRAEARSSATAPVTHER
jgi:AraC-like DNA-binding protein